MKKAMSIFVGIVVIVATAVLMFQHFSEPGSDQRPIAASNAAAQVAQGAYLARAGNCMACHTAQDGAPYAGGNALSTPFGTMYGPNLTPDKLTGLGDWTADDFWRAMHNGKSKDGSFLYPAFPYPNYTKVSRADSDAIYAFFRTLTPVRQQNREHQLRFPYNQRSLLAFWRTLYFTPGEYRQAPLNGNEWNRGAYLVQGLGHCSACHSARNALGASLGEERLGGGMVGDKGWHASALGGARDVRELAELLQTGVSERNAVYGPMAEVVQGSLQYLEARDIGAIAAYLVTLPPPNSEANKPDPAKLAAAEPSLKLGRKIYEKQCASCHGEQGEGVPKVYPRLAGEAATARSNAIRLVVHGGFAPGTAGNPRPYSMPPFGGALSDIEIAAVLSYVRTSWGNQDSLVNAHEVERYRSAE